MANPVGLNLSAVAYSGINMPFLNLLKQSAALYGDLSYTPGTAFRLATDNSYYASGATSVTLAATPSAGQINAGDLVNFTMVNSPFLSDPNSYKVTSVSGATVTLTTPLARPILYSQYASCVVTATSRVGFDCMNLDANGYPTNLSGAGAASGKTFSGMDFGPLINNGGTESPPYPAGTYVFCYDGSDGHEVFSFTGDVTVTSGGNGRYLLTVVPGNNGIRVHLTSVGLGGNYPKNWRLIYGGNGTDYIGTTGIAATAGTGGSTTAGVNGTGTWEALYNAGEIFTPTFVSRISPLNSAIRFMDWLTTNQSIAKNWSERPLPNWITWNDYNKFWEWQGATPVEVCVALCNKINSNGWFNVPICATDSFSTSMATLVRDGGTDSAGKTWAGLASNLNAYVESGNELFNAVASLQAYGRSDPADPTRNNSVLGLETFPSLKAGLTLTASISGTTLTVTATSGTMPTVDGTSGNNARGFLYGGSFAIPEGVFPVSQLTGTAGSTGTYKLNYNCGTIASQTVTVVSSGNDIGASNAWFVWRGVKNGQLWKAVLGTRAKAVLGGQNGNPGTNRFVLSLTGTYQGAASLFTGTAASNCDCFAVAPYFGNVVAIPSNWTVAQLISNIQTGAGGLGGEYSPTVTGYISGTTLTVTAGPTDDSSIFVNQVIASGATAGTTITAQTSGTPGDTGTYTVSISQTVGSAGAPVTLTLSGGGLNRTCGYIRRNYGIAQNPSYGNGIQLVAYEGGQTLDASGGAFADATLFSNANLDSGMGDCYTSLLNAWKANGGDLFVHFNDIGVASTLYWGALMTIMDSSSPKYSALVSFVGIMAHRGGNHLGKF